MCEFLRVLKFS